MSNLLTFLIGLICGGIIATVTVCMCIIGKEADEDMKGE